MVVRLSDVRHGVGDYESLDDRMLVLDFQAGQPEAFVEIHKRYGSLARHVCRRLLPNTHDSDEAFQETMIRVFQGLHRFNGRYALQPWISRIATNVSLDMIRSRARRPALDERAIEDHDREDLAAGPEEAFEHLVQRDLVLAVLSDLPDTHRRALILREIEGRSHREIGDAIGISPAQAKALIHRAKGSFRRRWMQKAVERGGVAGIAVVPLLWLARMGETVRRVVDRAAHAAQAAQAAVPEIVSSAATQTVVSTTGGGFGERVIAASMTLIVAGGVTVGAATIVKDRNEGDRGVRTEAPAAVTPAAVMTPAPDPVEVTEPKLRPRFDDVAPKETQGPLEVLEETVVVEPSPTEELPVAAESPTPQPTESPSPELTQEPSPEPIPPAPAWTIGIQTWGPWSLSCDCSLSFQPVASEVKGDTSGQVFFVQEATGRAVDIDSGVQAWQLSAVYSGYAEGSQGRFSLFLDIETPEGDFSYEGWGVLEATQQTGPGGVEHTYMGRYRLVSFHPAEGPTEMPSVLPNTGVLRAETTWWADGTSLIGVALSLEER